MVADTFRPDQQREAFDISDGFPEGSDTVSEKSSRKKFTARLPSDTYSDTFSRVNSFDGKTGSLTNMLYKPTICKVLWEAKKCHVYFLEFFMYVMDNSFER